MCELNHTSPAKQLVQHLAQSNLSWVVIAVITNLWNWLLSALWYSLQADEQVVSKEYSRRDYVKIMSLKAIWTIKTEMSGELYPVPYAFSTGTGSAPRGRHWSWGDESALSYCRGL